MTGTVHLIVSYVRALRPIGWIPAWFALTMGMIDGGFSSLSKVVLALAVFGPLLLGASYILNLTADLKLDKTSQIKKDIEMTSQPFSTGLMSSQQGYLVAMLLTTSGLIASAVIGPWFLVFASYSAIIGAVYSLGPRLKSRPFYDLLANVSTFGTAAYLAGWSVFQTPVGASIPSVLWVSLLIGATYMLTVLLDTASDRKGGLTTISTHLGEKKSLRLGFLLYIGSTIFFVLTLYTHLLTLAYWILSPFIILGVRSYLRLLREPSRVYHVTRVGVISAIFGVTTLIPIYAILELLGINDENIIQVIISVLS
ncbi:MAG: UbiA prenyltransferase family protein [Nitrososphaerales archaeon]